MPNGDGFIDQEVTDENGNIVRSDSGNDNYIDPDNRDENINLQEQAEAEEHDALNNNNENSQFIQFGMIGLIAYFLGIF
jgi:hypothetical protein